MQEISKIILRITVNSTTNPICDTIFLDMKTMKNDAQYTSAIANATKWHAIVNVLMMKTEDAALSQPLPEHLEKPDNSTADELGKLHELHSRGILTSEEFSVQKERLLQ